MTATMAWIVGSGVAFASGDAPGLCEGEGGVALDGVPYGEVADAVADAVPGSVVEVCGIHLVTFPVAVDVPMTILGLATDDGDPGTLVGPHGALHVQPGVRLVVDGLTLQGGGGDSVGINLQPGAELELLGSEVEGFDTGILVFDGGLVTSTSSTVLHGGVGIRAFDDVVLWLNDVAVAANERGIRQGKRGLLVGATVQGNEQAGVEVGSDSVVAGCHVFDNGLAELLAGAEGGGIRAGTGVTISASTIERNRAVRGGGVYADGALVLRDTVVRDNRADEGGGLFAVADVLAKTSSLAENTASVTGGGLAFATDDPTPRAMEGLVVEANRAPRGGGVAILSAPDLTLRAITVTDNVGVGAKTARGAGIAVHDPGTAGPAGVIVADALVAGNRFEDEGGRPTTGLGEGFHVAEGAHQVSVRTSRIDHAPDATGAVVLATAGATFGSTCSDWTEDPVDVNGAVAWFGTSDFSCTEAGCWASAPLCDKPPVVIR